VKWFGDSEGSLGSVTALYEFGGGSYYERSNAKGIQEATWEGD